jgi:outer membrane protein
MIDKKWFFNASVRYIDIETDAEFDVTGPGADALGISRGSIETVDIDPFVYTVSIGYRF